MKVILKQDIKGLGKAGAIAEVAEGYGRNYLLPRGLADEATSGNLTQLAGKRAAQAKRDEKQLAAVKELAVLLSSRPIEVTAKGGETGRLFGAITNAQIAEAVKAQFGVEVDRHKIELPEPIKSVGDHACPVKLALGVAANITVRVTAR